ncbi:MAG: hypothetical protein V7731_14520 [Amphritea sp.]
MKYRYDKALVILLSGFLSTGCMFLTEPQPTQPAYSGADGMSEYNITPQVYIYHYENGFTGIDALGWEPDLQYAWSRIGAAITCKIPLDKQQLIDQLGIRFGHQPVTHELNGIGFHAVQSRKVPGFCTEKRQNEISKMISNYQAGKFPTPRY